MTEGKANGNEQVEASATVLDASRARTAALDAGYECAPLRQRGLHHHPGPRTAHERHRRRPRKPR